MTTTITAGHTTLKVSKGLADKLKELGGKGETYEDVIWRLTEHYENTVGKPIQFGTPGTV